MIIFGGDRTAPLKAKEHGFRSKQYVPWSVRTYTMYQRPASYVALGNVASRLSSSGIAT